jgi:siroheme decarboxylase
MSTPQIDALDRKILDTLQHAFPLCERPFAELGRQAGIGEEEALARVARLRAADGPIRQISAIFDSQSLGYRSTLVAGQYEAGALDPGAALVCRHPGVSHCYERNHRYNLWYTLAVPPTSRLGVEGTIDRLHHASGAVVTRILPAVRLFKIGVDLDVTGSGAAASTTESIAYSSRDREVAVAHPIGGDDIPVIRALQEDLTVELRPFDRIAALASCTTEVLFEAARRLLERRQLRRYAAVLRHRRAGFTANYMVCWRVAEGRTEQVGGAMARFRWVSHCYLRPTYDDWPYNLYTMIHGRSVEECTTHVREMAAAANGTEHLMLESLREFKKTRVRYFTREIEAWEAEQEGQVFGSVRPGGSSTGASPSRCERSGEAGC